MRRAIANVIDHGLAAEVFTYDTVPDVENLPAVIVEPLNADFTEAMGRGMDLWEFRIYVLVSRSDTQQGQEDLDQFISGAGPNSIRQVIFNNPTLGLASVDDATVYAMKGYGGSFETGKVPIIGAVLKLRVLTDGRV